MDDALLVMSAAVVGALLAASWVVLLIRGAVTLVRGRRESALADARERLTRGVCQLALEAGDLQALRRLALAERFELVAALAPHLRGHERAWLDDVAIDLGLRDQAIWLCRSAFWWRRLLGVRLLTMIGGGEAVVLRLSADPDPGIRAQVAEWVGANSTPAGVQTLIGMLSDPAPACRFTVENTLLRLGPMIVDALAQRIRVSGDPTELWSALHVARAIGDPDLLPAVLAASESPDLQARVAATRALGGLGGAAATDRVLALLEDPEVAVRATAASALADIGYWSGAIRIRPLLMDTEWDVRAAAGAALARLGAPGLLVLRGAIASQDPFAADMARLSLDSHRVVSPPPAIS